MQCLFSPGFLSAFPQGSMVVVTTEVSDPLDFISMLHGMEHERACREVRGPKKGGSLTSPTLPPVTSPGPLGGRGETDRDQQDSVKWTCYTRSPESGTHPPMSVFHFGTSPPIRPRSWNTGRGNGETLPPVKVELAARASHSAIWVTKGYIMPLKHPDRPPQTRRYRESSFSGIRDEIQVLV